MKNLLFCLAVLFLSSCIPVHNFGTYWKKGTVDPALLGTWIPIASPSHDDDRKEARTVYIAGKKRVRVVNVRGTYQIESLNQEDRQQKNYAPITARTLSAGPYTFLMVIDKEGTKKNDLVRGLIRYKLEGNVFRQYSLADGSAEEFLKKKYPRAKNIKKPDCTGKESKMCFSFVRINTLDDEVLKILSQIPDTREFWTEDGAFRRQPQ